MILQRWKRDIEQRPPSLSISLSFLRIKAGSKRARSKIALAWESPRLLDLIVDRSMPRVYGSFRLIRTDDGFKLLSIHLEIFWISRSFFLSLSLSLSFLQLFPNKLFSRLIQLYLSRDEEGEERAAAVSRMPLLVLFPFIGPSRPGRLSARLIARAAVIQLTAPRMWRTRTLPSAASSSNLFIVAAGARSSRFLDSSQFLLSSRRIETGQTNLSFSIGSRSKSD